MPSSALSLGMDLPPFRMSPPESSIWWYAADAQNIASDNTMPTLVDSSGYNRNLSSSGSPLMTLVGSTPAIQLDGIDDQFDSGATSVPVNGYTTYTIGVVSTCEDSGFSPQDPARNCLIYFPENSSWGIVNVSPFQSTIMTRYGTGQSGNLPAYTRPSNIGTAITSTIWVKDNTTEYLYVNGTLVQTFTGKQSTISNTDNRLKIGFTDGTNTYYKGKLFETIAYTNASVTNGLINYFNLKYGV